MQFQIDSLNILAQLVVPRSWLDKQRPPVSVVFVGLEKLCSISDQKSCKDSFLYDLLFLPDAVWVSYLQLIPKLSFRDDFALEKGCSAERAPLILHDESGFGETVLAKDVLALDQTQWLVEDAEADGALMVLQHLLSFARLLIFHHNF